MFFSRFLFWSSGSKSTLLKRNIFLNIVSWNFPKYISRFLSYFVSGVAVAGVLETNGVLYENAVISTRNSDMQHDCSSKPTRSFWMFIFFWKELLAESDGQIIFTSSTLPTTSWWNPMPPEIVCMSFEDPIFQVRFLGNQGPLPKTS